MNLKPHPTTLWKHFAHRRYSLNNVRVEPLALKDNMSVRLVRIKANVPFQTRNQSRVQTEKHTTPREMNAFHVHKAFPARFSTRIRVHVRQEPSVLSAKTNVSRVQWEHSLSKNKIDAHSVPRGICAHSQTAQRMHCVQLERTQSLVERSQHARNVLPALHVHVQAITNQFHAFPGHSASGVVPYARRVLPDSRVPTVRETFQSRVKLERILSEHKRAVFLVLQASHAPVSAVKILSRVRLEHTLCLETHSASNVLEAHIATRHKS